MNQPSNHHSSFLRDAVVTGAALFSMFFGAGNMIFPPALGFFAGDAWITGFISYYLADIGLAMLAMFAMFHRGGAQSLIAPLGKASGNALLSVIALCLSVIIAVPRTAATTFELSIQPLFPDVPMVLFVVFFFALVFVLCLSESAVVDIVGKILTPLLFLGLIVLIICGILHPVGDITAKASLSSAVSTGISSGYQTMDVFGSIFLGTLILNSAAEKGYGATKTRLAAYASVIASIGIFIVYFGLTYLGATASSLFPENISQTVLLTNLIRLLIPSSFGTVFFGAVVGLACLTTAIALITSTVSFFYELFARRISYRSLLLFFCAVSAVVASVGVSQIITVAGYILTIVYPPILVLVALSFFDRFISSTVYHISVGTALIFSLLDLVAPALTSALPLSAVGLCWLLPAAVTACGTIITLRLVRKPSFNK